MAGRVRAHSKGGDFLDIRPPLHPTPTPPPPLPSLGTDSVSPGDAICYWI